MAWINDDRLPYSVPEDARVLMYIAESLDIPDEKVAFAALPGCRRPCTRCATGCRAKSRRRSAASCMPIRGTYYDEWDPLQEPTLAQSAPVRETFEGKTVWNGVVYIFDLAGHPTAIRAYAWSSPI